MEGSIVVYVQSANCCEKRFAREPDRIWSFGIIAFFFFPSASFFYSLRQLEDSSIEFARFGELRSMCAKKKKNEESLVSHCARKCCVCVVAIFSLLLRKDR